VSSSHPVQGFQTIVLCERNRGKRLSTCKRGKGKLTVKSGKYRERLGTDRVLTFAWPVQEENRVGLPGGTFGFKKDGKVENLTKSEQRQMSTPKIVWCGPFVLMATWGEDIENTIFRKNWEKSVDQKAFIASPICKPSEDLASKDRLTKGPREMRDVRIPNEKKSQDRDGVSD